MLLLILSIIVAIAFYYIAKLVKYLQAVLFQEDLRTSHINEPHPTSVNKDNTAVVIGGSVAGLLTATTLSRHFRKVIVLEQQKIEEGKSIAPQGEQIHVLLIRGRDILMKMFPDFVETSTKKGTRWIDFAETDMYSEMGGRRGPLEMGEFEAELGKVGTMSRRNLEQQLRDYVSQIENIEVRDETTVSGLLFEQDRVIGVKVIYDLKEQDVHADLTVDCSGTNSKNLAALVAQQDPQCKDINKYKTVLKQNIIYSTTEFTLKSPDGVLRIRERDGIPTRILFCLAKFPKSRGLVSYEIEDGRAMLMVGGKGKHNGVRTKEEVIEFMSSEPEFTRESIRLIFEEQAVEEELRFKIYKKDGCTYNHFEKVNLKGFIALGDALASFNPVYGQGMTSAGECCVTLDRILRASKTSINQDDNICNELQQLFAYSVTYPWFTASVVDLASPEVKGGNPFVRKYIIPKLIAGVQRDMDLAIHDKEVRKRMMKSQHMVYGYKTQPFEKLLKLVGY
jgi:2-polyprenyl-6-methoxyphenol hydroxylase-like FAD-dependent oxidoreductase